MSRLPQTNWRKPIPEAGATSIEAVGLIRIRAGLLWRSRVRRGVRFAALRANDVFHRLARGALRPRFAEVADGLHVGGQFLRHGLSYLQAQGLTVVVKMRSEFDDRAAGLAPPGCLHLPTVDNTPPTPTGSRGGARFIDE